jgi:putative ABC transport system ATP-binding protein
MISHAAAWQRPGASGGERAVDDFVCARDLRKVYRRGLSEVEALRGVSLTAGRGEFLAIVGASGSGKSTLLHLLGGLDRPSEGFVSLAGCDLGRAGDRELSRIRRRMLGFVFQFFNLYPTMTAAENVALPWLLDGRPLKSFGPRRDELLHAVGLSSRGGHLPHQLSGGEMQRACLARALALDPPLLLADEPTGNLDSANGAAILDLLEAQTRQRGKTVVLATHDDRAVARADRVVRLADGRVASDPPA